MALRETVITILVYAYTVSVMLGLGASINVDIVAEVRRAPRAVLSGIVSQYLFMPLTGFVLALLFGVGDTEATAILLLAMSPGGVTSTLFVYWCEANVTISLVMTTLSTIFAFAAMPLLLFVYLRPPLVDNDNDSKVNNVAIFATLLVATTPAIVGWRLRRWKDALGQKVEAVATQCGVALIVAALVALFAWPTKDGRGFTAKTLAVLLLMSPCGFFFGYAGARFAGLDEALRRTVSIETGIQQVGIAGAIAVNSFKGDQRDRMVAVIAVFGLITFVCGCVYSLALRRFFPLSSSLPPVVEKDDDDDVHNDDEAAAAEKSKAVVEMEMGESGGSPAAAAPHVVG